MKVRKILALILSAVMVIGILAACENNTGAPATSPDTSSPTTSTPPSSPPPDNSGAASPPPAPVEIVEDDWQHFTQPEAPAVAGRPTVPSGLFTVGENVMNGDFYPGWSNLVGNARVKEMLYGYGTIDMTDAGLLVPNPMVLAGLLIETNADKSKTYTMKIHENLKFSDGTPITAEHFVFNALLSSSPEILELGCSVYTGSEVYNGAEAFHKGETNVFTGVRLLGDYEFSLTVDYETVSEVEDEDEDGNVIIVTQTDINFPFWFQLSYASVSPAPIHVLAPGCSIADDGKGAYIAGPWSTDLLRSTLDDGSVGYRYTPSVTTGPYKFVNYDEGANIAVIEVNPYFLGDYQGFKPMIKNIAVKQVANAVMAEEFRTGGVNLLVNTSGGTNINALLDYCDESGASYSTFLRNGYGKLAFHCSDGPTQFAAVRRAFTYCLDRDEVVRQWTGGYGTIVHSRIGAAQWMYAENIDFVNSKLTAYTLNPEKAKQELIDDGWVLDSAGNAYTSGVRYKKLADGSLMGLIIEWASPNSNNLGSMYDNLARTHLESIGFQVNREELDSTAWANALYGYSDKYYHVVNGGTGFAAQDSPWYYYDPSNADPPNDWNSNFLKDEELYRYTMEMKNTEPGDNEAYFAAWLKFVIRFNELMPDIPCYSDEYFDFYNGSLKNYYHTAAESYTYALVRSWIE